MIAARVVCRFVERFSEIKSGLEKALNEGRGLTILGERGKPSASEVFVTRLEGLSPSFRRLAVARACAAPWARRIDEMPDCYRQELLQANAEVGEDRGAYPDMDARIAELFAEVPEPISEVLLRQIVSMTPASRYGALIFSFACAWPGGPRRLADAPDAAQWLYHELQYSLWLQSDEWRAWKEEGWVE